MIVAVGKGIGRAHAASQKSAQVRLPLTWAILAHGRQVVTSMVDDGMSCGWVLGCRTFCHVVCRCGLTRMQEVHSEFCPTRNCLTLFQGEVQVAIENRSANPARRQMEVASVHDVCAGGGGRSRIHFRRTRAIGVDWITGERTSSKGRRLMVWLALWCEILLSPAGEGAGHKLRVSPSHLSSRGFVVGKLNGDPKTGPGG